MKLTNDTVNKLVLGAKTDLIVFDEDMAGFGIRLRLGVDGKERRSWIVQYKNKTGGTRRIMVGKYPLLNATDARKEAKVLLGRVAKGEDPQAERRDRRDKNALTLRSQATGYLAAKAAELKPSTLAENTRYLTDEYYFGPLHPRPIDTITRRDVAARIEDIQQKSGNAAAKKARASLGAFFAWAMRRGDAQANPCIGAGEEIEIGRRDRVLTDGELAAVWRACGDDDYGRIVKLLILTGCRRAEIGGMAWSEFSDLDGPQPSWTLPAARSKNAKAHKLPLMPMALAIVRSVPRMVSRDPLFGARASCGFSAWPKAKLVLDRACGVESWTVHDLRRTVATGLANIGVMPHVIEAILNHQSGHKAGVAGIYNRSAYEREVRAALAMWEDHLRSLIEGGERKVLSFPQAIA
jgi:integrase